MGHVEVGAETHEVLGAGDSVEVAVGRTIGHGTEQVVGTLVATYCFDFRGVSGTGASHIRLPFRRKAHHVDVAVGRVQGGHIRHRVVVDIHGDVLQQLTCLEIHLHVSYILKIAVIAVSGISANFRAIGAQQSTSQPFCMAVNCGSAHLRAGPLSVN